MPEDVDGCTLAGVSETSLEEGAKQATQSKSTGVIKMYL